MRHQRFDAFARFTSAVLDRRGSLKTLSAAALAAAAAQPALSQARKAGKKASKRCQRQGNGCRESFAAGCQDAPDPDACLEVIDECCGLLGNCQADAFLECLFPVQALP